MHKKIFLLSILIPAFSTLNAYALLKDCCKGHGGTSNCNKGFIVCADYYISDCSCVNKILEPDAVNKATTVLYNSGGPAGMYAKKKMLKLEKPKILTFTWVRDLKNKGINLVKKEKN